MANTWTDYGISQMLDITFRGAAAPTACSVRLLSSLSSPNTINEDTEGWTAVSGNEVSNANGYTTGGLPVELSSVGFDVLSELGANQFLQIKDLTWTSSGTLSAAGAALVMTQGGTDYVWAVFDFGGTVTASSGGTLKLENCELRVGV